MAKSPKTLSQLRAEKRGDKSTRTQTDRYYEQQRKADPKQRAAKKLYNSARWKKVRALKLSRNPICETCAENGRTTGHRLHVHHIQHVHDAPHQAFDLDNLRTVCLPCHNREHSQR